MVPESVAVPLPLSTKMIPVGNEPAVRTTDVVGKPVVVTVKVPKVPAVNDVLFVLEIVGARLTVSEADAAGELSAIGVVAAPVLSWWTPGVLLVTVTKMLHVVFAGTTPFVIANVPPFGVAKSVPPHPVPFPLGFGFAELLICAG